MAGPAYKPLRPLLRRREVADVLGVSVRSIDRLTHSGALPRVKIGDRAVRFRGEDVAALVERGREASS
jgi:excisionase family DNA binding protein